MEAPHRKERLPNGTEHTHVCSPNGNGTANRHALSIGVSALTPSEGAALHTLHGLVAQLDDRATPKAMWPNLIKAITSTMDKFTTVPFILGDIAKLPVIEAESRLRELAP